MKRYLVLLCVVSVSFFTSSAMAKPQVGAYISTKFNRVFIRDLSGSQEGIGFNFGAGYSFGIAAIEYERARYNAETYYIGGNFYSGYRAQTADIKIDTDAVYWVMRSSGDWFAKFKAGFLKEEVSILDVSEDDTGASWGLGFGYQTEGLRFEVEATQVEQDVQALTLGFNILF